MINIVLCDDEKSILQQLCTYTESVLAELKLDYEITAFEQPLELMQALKCENIDILLLDIDLPQVNGMEIASELKKLKHSPLLIFVTCHESLVYESFQYQPFDFIRKSCYEKDLRLSLLRAVKQLVGQKKDYVLEQPEGIVRLRISEILYFESCANYLKIVTDNNKYQQRKSLQNVESELKDFGFVRIHRGYLVNQRAVQILKNDKVILLNREELPIGRHYSVAARETLINYLRG